MKLYYLTRSYYPYQKGGGPLMRRGAVNYLQDLGWDIEVIMPNYDSKEIINEGNITQIPFQRKHIQKLASLLERIGVYEDYLDKWVEVAFKYLKNKIRRNDIVFATSGGELGMIKLGSLLKKEIGCKFVVNFRDPINYGFMNGLRRDYKFHIGREKAHANYIINSDLIITSSLAYAEILKKWIPFLRQKIKCNYFGYIKKINLNLENESLPIKIAYVGTMSKTQSPELLYYIWKKSNLKNIEIYYIGDIDKYRPLKKIRSKKDKSVYFIKYMSHEKFLNFMEDIDIGFLSLTSDYFGVCIPSKLYEYINLGKPIFAALPDGDAKNIINYNKYGIAENYKDLNKLVEGMQKIADIIQIKNFKKNILNDRDKWFMKNRIKEVDVWLKTL
ncbi:glycosyltransferase family protein [Nautilia lithotrophica]